MKASVYIRERIENKNIFLFNPLKRAISIFDINRNPIKRKGFNEWNLKFPLRAVLDIESSCNSGCKYCSCGHDKKNGRRISLEKVCGIIDELEKMRVFELSLRGGEPTIHPDFEKIWDYAQNKKFLSTNVITNGLILNYQQTRLLLKKPEAKIIISLDGFPEINNFYRDPRQYEQVIAWLPKILQEFPYQIVIITCLYEDSAKNVERFSKYLAGLGLKFHDFSPLRKQGGASNYGINQFLSFGKMKKIQQKLNGLKNLHPFFRPLINCGEIHREEYQNMRDFPVPLFNEIYRNTTVRITANGDVLISTRVQPSHLKNKKNIKYTGTFGNIFKSSLENIWLSSREMRRKQVSLFYKNIPLFLGWKKKAT